MKIVDRSNGDVSRVKIFGLLQNGCYSVKVTIMALQSMVKSVLANIMGLKRVKRLIIL